MRKTDAITLANFDPQDVAAFLYGLNFAGSYDRIRSLQRSLATTTLSQLKLNSGLSYIVSRLVNDLANGANADIWLAVGNTPIWCNFTCVSSGEAQGYLYEAATQSAAGTNYTPVNENRLSANVSDVAIEFDPTISTLGTRIGVKLIPGGGGVFAIGGALDLTRADRSFLLAPNVNYLFRVNNTSGGLEQLTMQVDFYED